MLSNKTLFALVAAAAALMLAAPAAPGGDDASDLAARAKAWQDAYNAGNLEAVAGLYTEDAMRLPYQAATLQGRAAIAANLKENHDAGLTKIDIKVLGTESHGDLAWGHGTYALMNAAGATVQEGKWMNVSKQIGGAWLIHSDIWNTNTPDAPAM
ncbi:MAG TPA: DUF4440 domain-containing protein [Acidobacteriota bacterium]|jgi:uncharacterized protein (TIGR02246 family)